MESHKMVDLNPENNLVCVIEPKLVQLIGAYLQYLSLESYPTKINYNLYIVGREEYHSKQIYDWGKELGLNCEISNNWYHNPYLNKWLFLDMLRKNKNENIVLLDWDIIYVGNEYLPVALDDYILCRKNPNDLYKELFNTSKINFMNNKMITNDGEIISSINSGVIISKFGLMEQCFKKTLNWEKFLEKNINGYENWMIDQAAVSIAVGEIGLKYLDNIWNVTPLSPVNCDEVMLWHYNDSANLTRNMKRNLLRPRIVIETINELKSRWGKVVYIFSEIYNNAITKHPFSSFVY